MLAHVPALRHLLLFVGPRLHSEDYNLASVITGVSRIMIRHRPPASWHACRIGGHKGTVPTSCTPRMGSSAGLRGLVCLQSFSINMRFEDSGPLLSVLEVGGTCKYTWRTYSL